LGIDVGRICSETEQHVAEVFVAELNDETSLAYNFVRRARVGFFDESDAREQDLKSQIVSFSEGFQHGLLQQ